MASAGIGSQFGAKKEVTWGTAATVDKFFEFESESLNLDQTYVDALGLRAARTFAPSSADEEDHPVRGRGPADRVPAEARRVLP